MCKTNTVTPSNRFLINSPLKNSWISCVMLLLMTLSILISSCDTQNGVDREAVKREMANRELKRLRNSDILKRGEEIGKKYFETSTDAAALADSLKLEVKVLIVAETEEEKQLLEAFSYAVENNQDIEDYLSDTPQEIFFYHPKLEGDSLLVTRITIAKKVVVQSL